MEYDCSFQKDDRWFRYRAAAIIVEDGCVLFAGNEKDDYLYSVGGAVHAGEKAEDAVVREVYEETGVRYEVERLAFIHENFFYSSGKKDVVCHELALYYVMKPRGSKALNCRSVTAGGVKETMHWIPVNELGKYKAYPAFMEEWLNSGHTGIEHIVTDERE